MTRWAVAMVAVVAMASGAGAAPVKARCRKVCADDVRACQVAVRTSHACGRMRGAEAKTCRTARRAARHACRALRRQCAEGKAVCSGQ